MSDPILLSKDQFFEKEEKKLKKENPKADGKKIRDQLDGRWQKYKAENEKKQKQANKKAKEGLRRMGPQLMGQLLVVALVLLGNYIYFQQRRRGDV